MRTTELFTIDGQPMLVPDENFSMHQENVVSADSGMDESGVYHLFGVRKNVRNWDFSFSRLTQREYAYMETLFAGKNTFRFGFASPFDTKVQVVTAYRSKRSIQWHNVAEDQFRDYRFRITEC